MLVIDENRRDWRTAGNNLFCHNSAVTGNTNEQKILSRDCYARQSCFPNRLFVDSLFPITRPCRCRNPGGGAQCLFLGGVSAAGFFCLSLPVL